jgi:hypothetical protein
MRKEVGRKCQPLLYWPRIFAPELGLFYLQMVAKIVAGSFFYPLFLSRTTLNTEAAANVFDL